MKIGSCLSSQFFSPVFFSCEAGTPELETSDSPSPVGLRYLQPDQSFITQSGWAQFQRKLNCAGSSPSESNSHVIEINERKFRQKENSGKVFQNTGFPKPQRLCEIEPLYWSLSSMWLCDDRAWLLAGAWHLQPILLVRRARPLGEELCTLPWTSWCLCHLTITFPSGFSEGSRTFLSWEGIWMRRAEAQPSVVIIGSRENRSGLGTQSSHSHRLNKEVMGRSALN